MKSSFTSRTAILLFAVLLILSGCASSTMIKSVPSEADVYINGELVGKTPYLYTDTRVSFSPVMIDIVKEGYKPLYTSFRRDEEFNPGTFVGGFFIWPIWLWTLDYKPSRTYNLIPLVNSTSGDTVTEIEYSGTKLEKLRELKKMLDEKLITEDEYQKQKAKILEEK
jgi:hypothetical protein